MSSDHHGHARHDHTHSMAKHSLRIAFLLTIIILAAELIGGLLANSLALLSDAGHVVTDLFALGLAWFASVQAEKLPDERKTFGYHRVGILAALVNAVSLIVIVLVISWQAIGRFQHPEAVQPLIMFISAAIGIAINLLIGFVLQRESHNLNVRAAALHVFGDVGASCGVIIAGLLILLTGWTFLDPLLSIAISVLIALSAWHILRETTDILLEATPKNISMSQLVKDMMKVRGVQDVHDLHVWSITSGMSALSCHVLIDNLPPSDSAPILQSLTEVLREKYHVGHTTIQFECDAHKAACCVWDGLYCRMETKERCCNHNQQEQEVHAGRTI
ncbi:MAG: cation transporter [Ktedonobacteraceae bacterium]|nr:cation transporter [Ktedonobacteraceae bacterium]